MGAYPKRIFRDGPGTAFKEAHSLEQENKFRAEWGKPPKHPHGHVVPVEVSAPVEKIEAVVAEVSVKPSPKVPEVVIKKGKYGKK